MHDEINVWGYMELLPKYLIKESNFKLFELNSKGLYLIPEKKRKKIVVLHLHPPCEIRKFRVLCVGRQRSVQKSVMHMQNCCCINLNF